MLVIINQLDQDVGWSVVSTLATNCSSLMSDICWSPLIMSTWSIKGVTRPCQSVKTFVTMFSQCCGLYVTDGFLTPLIFPACYLAVILLFMVHGMEWMRGIDFNHLLNHSKMILVVRSCQHCDKGFYCNHVHIHFQNRVAKLMLQVYCCQCLLIPSTAMVDMTLILYDHHWTKVIIQHESACIELVPVVVRATYDLTYVCSLLTLWH